MKKNLFYLCVLFIWSVGGAYAASGDKPLGMSCMDWLAQLEAKRDKLLQQVKDQKSFEELGACTEEISATIGGKYGISSTPATPQEREKIVRSIHRTRQMYYAESNYMCTYFKSNTTEEPFLSENLLLEIANRTDTKLEVLKSHLAAIAVVDGASFSLKAGDQLDPESIQRNILLIHDDAYKDNFNRLLGPIFEPVNKPLVGTIIQTLKKVASTSDAPVRTFLKSDFLYHEVITFYEEQVNKSFFKFCHSLSETSHDLSADERKRLQMFARLKIGTVEQNLNLISTIEANVKTDIAKYVEDIEGKPDSVLVGLLYVNAGKKLGKDEKWIKAVCNRIMNDPRVHSYVLIELVNFLKESAISDGPTEIQIWTRLLALEDSSPDDLIFAANALKELDNKELESKVLKKVMLYPYPSTRGLIDAAVAFNRLGENDLALTAWNRAIEHDDAATISTNDIIWAVRNLGDLGEAKGKTVDLLNKAIDHSEVTPIQLMLGAEALEILGAGTERTLELVNKALKHPDADNTLNPSNLCWAADVLEKLDKGNKEQALTLLNQAIDHHDITPDLLTWAAEVLEKLPDSELKTQTQEKIKKLESHSHSQ